jgi:hypothetical protein
LRIADAVGWRTSELVPMTGFPGHEEHRQRVEKWLASRQVVGAELAELLASAKAENVQLRVLSENGRRFARTADLRFNRVNVDVVDGRVSRIDGIY